MKGKFYGIGVGVGESDMITLKAIKVFKELDIVVLPEAKRKEGSTAYEIAKDFFKKEVEFIFVEFPMLKDIEERKKFRERNANEIKKYLNEGKTVGFLTIGDPMVYSTYVYVLEYLDEDYVVETIPGITSFTDISSRLNFPLVIGEESLKIISLNKKTNIIKEIESADNLVFMKVSRNFENLKNALRETKNLENVVMVSNCGKSNEKIEYNIEKIKEEDIPYFTTLILKKGGLKEWKKFIL